MLGDNDIHQLSTVERVSPATTPFVQIPSLAEIGSRHPPDVVQDQTTRDDHVLRTRLRRLLAQGAPSAEQTILYDLIGIASGKLRDQG